MRGTCCAETFTTIDALPPEALTLLNAAASPFAGRAWWEVVLDHAMPADAQASFVVIRPSGQPNGQTLALLPMLRTSNRLTSLTTPYTCEYMPLVAAGLDSTTRVATMAGFCRFCASSGVVRLDALPIDWGGLSDLRAGARQAGLRILRFNHFGNWYEDVDGLDWSAYLQGRPGALRETIKRRLRRAEKLPCARFDLFTQPAQMDMAADAFESVYRRSWKDVEPFPTFNVALMRAMATLGLLRFGVWSIGTEPVAAQLWVLKDRRAIVLKLAHDEAFKDNSPGTVLTALMLRRLLDQEHVVRIDFGRGDDAYKQGWAAQRQQRIGVLLVNPWRATGLAALTRHALGRIIALALPT
jgi:CelD/BcsL family acetyltransferase involved in cellulose biosynthesis